MWCEEEMEISSLDDTALTNCVNVEKTMDLLMVRLLTKRGRLVICLRLEGFQ